MNPPAEKGMALADIDTPALVIDLDVAAPTFSALFRLSVVKRGFSCSCVPTPLIKCW